MLLRVKFTADVLVCAAGGRIHTDHTVPQCWCRSNGLGMPKMGSRGYANYRIGVGDFQTIRMHSTGLPEEEDGCVVATIVCQGMVAGDFDSG